MSDFDNNATVNGGWFKCSPKKGSKSELDRDFSIEHIKDKDSLETNYQETPSCSQGALRERIAARSGFNAPRLTISSPDHRPETLIESPVFFTNPLRAQASPTTGMFSSIPSDKAKDEFFDDITTYLASQSISGRNLYPTNIGLEPNDDSQDYEQRKLGGNVGDLMASGAPDDGYNWRKYGQKAVKGRECPRSYYKCTHLNCNVKKKVEESQKGQVIEIIYSESHNHPQPRPNHRSGIGSAGTDLDMQIDGTEQEGFAGTNEKMEWTSPECAEFEYGSHSGSMHARAGTQIGYDDAAADEPEFKRRKLEAYAAETSGSTRARSEPRIMVLTTSDIDILDDGYRWRKYGQKVVKGNPNPRSYYKCTDNGCTATKHVERDSYDSKNVLTTYIGRHNHIIPEARNSSHVGSSGSGTLQAGLATQNRNHPVHYRVPHLRPPSGSSELSDIPTPGLAIGQENLSSLPVPAPDIGDPAGLMLATAEPKVEPVTPQELGSSESSFMYKETMS